MNLRCEEHWSSPEGNPDYADWAEKGARRFDVAKEKLGLPCYFAHASVGWDTNPRYPTGSIQPTVLHSTPEKFERALRRAKDWCDRHTPDGFPRLFTVNSWNEWTEGSYLEPCEQFGYGYLDAVRKVFVTNEAVAFGPRENPDDQYRRFSQATDLCYDDIVAGGFNALSFRYFGLNFAVCDILRASLGEEGCDEN